jgi:hypothetical protein
MVMQWRRCGTCDSSPSKQGIVTDGLTREVFDAGAGGERVGSLKPT